MICKVICCVPTFGKVMETELLREEHIIAIRKKLFTAWKYSMLALENTRFRNMLMLPTSKRIVERKFLNFSHKFHGLFAIVNYILSLSFTLFVRKWPISWISFKTTSIFFTIASSCKKCCSLIVLICLCMSWSMSITISWVLICS